MIPNIRRGTRVQGLLHYLWGPGKAEEHTDPHLVAAWDGAGNLADLEPAITPAGKRDFRHLAELLEIPVRAGRNPPRKPVWHCSVRAHADDPLMTDDRWRQIAEHVLNKTGLVPPGDTRAVRWIAMRHGPEHIHIVANLVRQDRRTNWARNDWPLAQAACRELEDRYDLVRVGRPGQSSRAWPTGAETHKAARTGRPTTAREELRRRVRLAATAAVDEHDFFTRLTADGTVQAQMRPSTRNPGEITGYSVALAGHTNANGDPIFYGGSKLAADLSLTRLRTRWQPDTTLAASDRRAQQLRPVPAEVYERAAALITDAAGHLAGNAENPRVAAGIAHAAADLLAATAAVWEGTTGGPITQAAELFDRAAHEPTRTTPARTGGRGYPLRSIARLINTTRAGTANRGQRELKALLRLIKAMAGLADALAHLLSAHGRLHQAHAARAAAATLRVYTPPPASSADPATPTAHTTTPGLDPWRTHQPGPRRHR